MPWWATLYLAVLIGTSIAGVVDDFKMGRPVLAITLIFSLVICSYFVFGYFSPAICTLPFVLVIGLFIFSFAVESYSVALDLADSKLQPDAELSDKENRAIMLISEMLITIIVMPAYFAGAVVIFRG